MKKLIDQILALIKKSGIEVKGEELEDFKERLASVSLKDAGFIELGDDQIVVSEQSYNEQRKDLRTLRQAKNDLQSKVDDLTETLKSGDSLNLKRAETAEDKLKKQEPLVEKLMTQARTRWDRISKTIPQPENDTDVKTSELRKRFKFGDPQKGDEGKLSDDDVLANLDNVEEFRALGLLEHKEPDDKTIITPSSKNTDLKVNISDDDKVLEGLFQGSAGNAR